MDKTLYVDIVTDIATILPMIPLLETFDVQLGIPAVDDFTDRNQINVVWNLPQVKKLTLDMSKIPRLIVPSLLQVHFKDLDERDIVPILFDIANVKDVRLTVEIHSNSMDYTDDEQKKLLPLLYDDNVLKMTELNCTNLPTRFIPLLYRMKSLEYIKLRDMSFPSISLCDTIIYKLLQS
jgi:hypothetical protein